jgi:hypothetical protein
MEFLGTIVNEKASVVMSVNGMDLGYKKDERTPPALRKKPGTAYPFVKDYFPFLIDQGWMPVSTHPISLDENGESVITKCIFNRINHTGGHGEIEWEIIDGLPNWHEIITERDQDYDYFLAEKND